MRRTAVFLSSFAAIACVLMGCSAGADPSSGASSSGGATYDVPMPQAATPDPCATPAEGCPCAEPGQKVTCKAVKAVIGSYVFCGGDHTCDAQTLTWGACVPSIAVVGISPDVDAGPTSGSGKH